MGRYVRAVLHRACRLARKWSNNTLPNPITDTELPEWSLAETGPAVRSPTVEEVRRLLSAAGDEQDPRVQAFVRLVAATGMRRREALKVIVGFDSARAPERDGQDITLYGNNVMRYSEERAAFGRRQGHRAGVAPRAVAPT
jgi:hypothetical protein